MHRGMIPGLVLLLLPLGCASYQLERSTLRQSSTMTDLRYQQVLDNLAMVLHNPALLPFYSSIGTGTAVVSDAGTSDVTFWNPGSLMPFAELKARRQITENWTMSPVYDGDRLEAMLCAYQILIFGTSHDCGTCAKQLRKFLPPNDVSKIVPGWFASGHKKDVPKNACYVGCYHDVYVWVLPEGVRGLTNFTLAILDIATVEPLENKPSQATQTTESYHYDPKTGKLREVTRTTREVAASATSAAAETMPRLPRKNLYNPLQSQIYALPLLP